jgi:hypothetical protein
MECGLSSMALGQRDHPVSLGIFIIPYLKSNEISKLPKVGGKITQCRALREPHQFRDA